MNDEVMKFMLRRTVEEHLKKERVYKDKRYQSPFAVFHRQGEKLPWL